MMLFAKRSTVAEGCFEERSSVVYICFPNSMASLLTTLTVTTHQSPLAIHRRTVTIVLYSRWKSLPTRKNPCLTTFTSSQQYVEVDIRILFSCIYDRNVQFHHGLSSCVVDFWLPSTTVKEIIVHIGIISYRTVITSNSDSAHCHSRNGPGL